MFSGEREETTNTHTHAERTFVFNVLLMLQIAFSDSFTARYPSEKVNGAAAKNIFIINPPIFGRCHMHTKFT